ncbi:hypothetical protein D9M68_893600 [compost metagenome]
MRPEAALREVEQRAARERDQRARPAELAARDAVEGHRADAARQVALRKRRARGAHGLQRIARQRAGQREAAAGLGGNHAFRRALGHIARGRRRLQRDRCEPRGQRAQRMATGESEGAWH